MNTPSTTNDEAPMPYDEHEECFKIRCASKSGRGLSDADLKKCERWLRLYPKQYAQMGDEVFEATKPFGSRV